MLLDFVRWIQGFVRFKIIGKFPERFVNIVSKSGISIWDTISTDEGLCASMYVKDYKRIRKLTKKSLVRLKIYSKHGLPFFIRKYKNRVGVLIGIVVFLLSVFLMSNFVWTIDISGLETISQAKVISVLEENGLYVGTYKPNVSFKTIERDTMLDIEDIGWMSVNVLNSHASVEIKEKRKPPQVDDYHQPANVKAKRDGLILDINTYEGKALFEKGSAVVKDQMIVSSVIEYKLGSVGLVRANAMVLAQTNRDVTFKVKKDTKKYIFGEQKRRRVLNIFGLNILFDTAFADETESLVRYSTSSLDFFDTILPVSVNTKNLYEKEQVPFIVNEKNAKKILYDKAALYESFYLDECIIKNREYKFFETDTHYCLNIKFTCHEDIAYQQDIDVDGANLEQIPVSEKETQ